jgi:hypothetical protein
MTPLWIEKYVLIRVIPKFTIKGFKKFALDQAAKACSADRRGFTAASKKGWPSVAVVSVGEFAALCGPDSAPDARTGCASLALFSRRPSRFRLNARSDVAFESDRQRDAS